MTGSGARHVLGQGVVHAYGVSQRISSRQAFGASNLCGFDSLGSIRASGFGYSMCIRFVYACYDAFINALCEDLVPFTPILRTATLDVMRITLRMLVTQAWPRSCHVRDADSPLAAYKYRHGVV